MASITKVILVRNSTWNMDGRLPVWEQQLSPKGMRMAQSLGFKLRQLLAVPPLSPDTVSLTRIIFCGPDVRCQQTAAQLSYFLNPKAGVHPVEHLALTAPGAVRWAMGTITANLGTECFTIVGHLPELNPICQELCHETRVELKECEAACFGLDTGSSGLWQVGSARLLWRAHG
jgi:phosphohistidine phosphatase SixA